MTRKQRESLVNWYIRRAQLVAGKSFPDGRDADLRDRGLALEYKRSVLRNEQARARKAFEARIAQARRDAMERWARDLPDNVTRLYP